MNVSKNTKEKKAQRIPNPVGPRLLPLKEAAQYLGLSVWTMRERIWAGDIPFIRFNGGKKMWIDIQDLNNFIEKNKTTMN